MEDTDELSAGGDSKLLSDGRLVAVSENDVNGEAKYSKSDRLSSFGDVWTSDSHKPHSTIMETELVIAFIWPTLLLLKRRDGLPNITFDADFGDS